MKKKKKFNGTMFCLFLTSLAVVVMIIFGLYSFEKNSMDKFNKRVRSTFIDIPEDSQDSEYDDEEDYYEGDDNGNGWKQVDQIKGNYMKYIFVGDSRYRGMEFLAGDEDMFFAENGRGYDFLLEQLSSIKYYCDENTAIIVGLGVNDNLTTGAQNYVNTLKELQDSVNGQVYYMLVNPVDEEKEQYNGYNVTNENVDIFNENIEMAMDPSIGIIDVNSHLKEIGFETRDGLHYDDNTYEEIYNYIKSDISNTEE